MCSGRDTIGTILDYSCQGGRLIGITSLQEELMTCWLIMFSENISSIRSKFKKTMLTKWPRGYGVWLKLYLFQIPQGVVGSNPTFVTNEIVQPLVNFTSFLLFSENPLSRLNVFFRFSFPVHFPFSRFRFRFRFRFLFLFLFLFPLALVLFYPGRTYTKRDRFTGKMYHWWEAQEKIQYTYR